MSGRRGARPTSAGLRRLEGAALLLAVFAAACGREPRATEPMASPRADARVFEDMQDFLDGYMVRPIPSQGSPPEEFSALEASLQPRDCGTCHVQQYQDWQTTVHSRAYSPGLSGQLVSQEDTNFGYVRSCYTCHAPLSEQAAKLQSSGGAYLRNPDFDHELKEHGLVCAACHVRGWRRYGAPRRDGSVEPSPPGSPHGGVTRSPFFEDPRLCGSCHQFESPAPNGKSLQNTLTEWRQSRYAREGMTCQKCHMPDRRHLWRGIHDPEMTASGITIEWVGVGPAAAREGGVGIRVTNSGTGHRFPTYVTPEVRIRVELLDGAHEPIPGAFTDSAIARRVTTRAGAWVELSDTRLAPDSSMVVTVPAGGLAAEAARATVTVHPDAFYQGVYRSLLSGALSDTSRVLLQKALRRTEESPYGIFDETISLVPEPPSASRTLRD
ncbi:MAG: multiheme c-type cytochrome [Gemmatimonadota bacterium]